MNFGRDSLVWRIAIACLLLPTFTLVGTCAAASVSTWFLPSAFVGLALVLTAGGPRQGAAAPDESPSFVDRCRESVRSFFGERLPQHPLSTTVCLLLVGIILALLDNVDIVGEAHAGNARRIVLVAACVATVIAQPQPFAWIGSVREAHRNANGARRGIFWASALVFAVLVIVMGCLTAREDLGYDLVHALSHAPNQFVFAPLVMTGILLLVREAVILAIDKSLLSRRSIGWLAAISILSAVAMTIIDRSDIDGPAERIQRFRAEKRFRTKDYYEFAMPFASISAVGRIQHYYFASMKGESDKSLVSQLTRIVWARLTSLKAGETTDEDLGVFPCQTVVSGIAKKAIRTLLLEKAEDAKSKCESLRVVLTNQFEASRQGQSNQNAGNAVADATSNHHREFDLKGFSLDTLITATKDKSKASTFEVAKQALPQVRQLIEAHRELAGQPLASAKAKATELSTKWSALKAVIGEAPPQITKDIGTLLSISDPAKIPDSAVKDLSESKNRLAAIGDRLQPWEADIESNDKGEGNATLAAAVCLLLTYLAGPDDYSWTAAFWSETTAAGFVTLLGVALSFALLLKGSYHMTLAVPSPFIETNARGKRAFSNEARTMSLLLMCGFGLALVFPPLFEYNQTEIHIACDQATGWNQSLVVFVLAVAYVLLLSVTLVGSTVWGGVAKILGAIGAPGLLAALNVVVLTTVVHELIGAAAPPARVAMSTVITMILFTCGYWAVRAGPPDPAADI